MDKNEDDTFRCLVRPSIKDIKRIYDVWIINTEDNRLWQEVLAENHWTLDEWRSACRSSWRSAK